MSNAKYQIVMRGIIDKSWAAFFTGMSIDTRSEGITVLTGDVADQSALHGLLNKVRDLNILLISVLLLEDDGIDPVFCRYCRLNKDPVPPP